jgi:hypothetical protein
MHYLRRMTQLLALFAACHADVSPLLLAPHVSALLLLARSIEDAMLKMLAIHDVDKIHIPDPATLQVKATLLTAYSHHAPLLTAYSAHGPHGSSPHATLLS